MKSGTLLEVIMIQPVIVCPCDIDGELTIDDLAKREAFGCIKHCPFDSYIVHKFQPPVHVDLPECAWHYSVQCSGMKVVQRRKDSPPKSTNVLVRVRHVV